MNRIQRSRYIESMKEYLAPRFKEARSERHLTKAEFAKALMLDVRSYNDIEQGYSLCNVASLVLFLCDYALDRQGIIRDLQTIILSGKIPPIRLHNDA